MSHQCKGKVRHPSRTGAVIALKRVKNAAMDIYRCSICMGWHLGRTREPSRCADRIIQVLDRYNAKLAERMGRGQGEQGENGKGKSK